MPNLTLSSFEKKRNKNQVKNKGTTLKDCVIK